MPRSRGGNAAAMIESEAGFIIAAPIPWARALPISVPGGVGEPAAERGEHEEGTIPSAKIRRRPNMSASLPPDRSRTPKTSA